MVTIERTCRYGHGPLKTTPEIWHLPCFAVGEAAAKAHTEAADVIFTLRVSVCPTCGYVELMDADV